MALGHNPLWIAAGALVWAAHFGAIYGYTAFACARGFDASVDLAVGAATIIACIAALALVARGLRRSASPFTGWMSAMVTMTALLAVLWEGSSVLGGTPCGLR